MSYVLSFKAAKCKLGNASIKAVLRCLCDYSDDNGTNCRPSTETISLETELDRRTVFKALACLATNDWIKVFKPARGARQSYLINAQKIETVFQQIKILQEDFYSGPVEEVKSGSKKVTAFNTESSYKNDTALSNSSDNVDTSSNNVTSNKIDTSTSYKNDTASGIKNVTKLSQYSVNTPSDNSSDDIVSSHSQETSSVFSSSPSLETSRKKATKKAAKASAVLKCPEDVPEELWKDFLEHRKHKQAPVTNRVLVLLRNEAKKAGWTLEAVINRIILRDWTGFEALWVKDEWIERLPGTGDKPIMVKREDFMRDQFVASDLSMFTPEAADLIQSVGVQNTRPFKDRIKPLKNVHSEKNVSNPSKVSSEDLSTDIDAFNDIPDDFKEGGER